MNKNDIPCDTLDLIIGYSKNQTPLSIPLCLNYMIGKYFLDIFKQILFYIKFKDASLNGALTSIFSKIIIINRNNDKYCKLILNIGKDLEIEILLFNSQIKAFGKTYPIQNIIGNPWKFEKRTDSELNVTNVEMILRLNRRTKCNCHNSDGSLEIYFRNVKKNDKYYGWTDPEDIEWTELDALVEITLKDDINWNSREEVLIKGYNIDEIKLIENNYINLACDQYGFGRQCCYWAAYEFYSEIE